MKELISPGKRITFCKETDRNLCQNNRIKALSVRNINTSIYQIFDVRLAPFFYEISFFRYLELLRKEIKGN